MRNLNKNSKGEQVKVLQGLLRLRGYNIAVDGSYGLKTQKAVANWEELNNLPGCRNKLGSWDGSCGPTVWHSLGVAKTAEDILLLKIPKRAITKSRVIVRDKEGVSFPKYAMNYPYNFIINAGMFNMPSKKLKREHWYEIVQDTVSCGKLVNGGNFTDKGISFGKTIKPTTTSKAMQEGLDFVGGAPAFGPVEDLKGISGGYLNQNTKWNLIGLDEEYFIYITNLTPMKISALTKAAKANGATTLINLDGGGSRALALAGNVALATDGRGIPECIGLQINY